MITEKDFIEAIMKAATYAAPSPVAGIDKRGGVRYHHKEMKAVFELAKKMAVEFETWRRIQEREGNKEVYGKTPAQLLELYLKSNG